MENQDGFKELLANDTVIYAVLKKLHITKAHNDYDDLVSGRAPAVLKGVCDESVYRKTPV